MGLTNESPLGQQAIFVLSLTVHNPNKGWIEVFLKKKTTNQEVIPYLLIGYDVIYFARKC